MITQHPMAKESLKERMERFNRVMEPSNGVLEQIHSGTERPSPVMQPSHGGTEWFSRLRHRLFFADSETPTSSAKPEGAKFCEIRMTLGGDKPTDPDSMSQLAMESRSPHRNDFDPGDEGKTAFYALRWLNTAGDPGPWSPVYSAVVPG